MRQEILSSAGVITISHKPHGFKTVYLDGIGWRLLPAGIYIDAYRRESQDTVHMRVRAYSRELRILEDFYFTSPVSCNRVIDKAIDQLVKEEGNTPHLVRKKEFTIGLDLEYYNTVYEMKPDLLNKLTSVFGEDLLLSPSHQYMADLASKYTEDKEMDTIDGLSSHHFGTIKRTGVMKLSTALKLRCSVKCKRGEFYKHLMKLHLKPTTGKGLSMALAKYRIASGLNVNQLSKLCGVPVFVIHTLEQGTRKHDVCEATSLMNAITEHTIMPTADCTTLGKQLRDDLLTHINAI